MRGNWDRLHALRGGIEGHDVVASRLVVADAPVRADRDPVRTAVRAAGAREVADLPRRRVEPAEAATCEIRVPDVTLRVHHEAPRARLRVGERELAQRAVVGVDAADLV